MTETTFSPINLEKILDIAPDFSIYKYTKELKDFGTGNDNPLTNGELSVANFFIQKMANVFDIGANFGNWTKLVLSLTIPEKIWAFEPIPDISRLLFMETFYRNNVRVFGNAVSNVMGKSKFHWYKDGQFVGMSNLFGRPQVEFEKGIIKQEIEVDTITVDHFCSLWNIKHIDFMKIDVEGAEQMVLEGAWKTIQQDKIDVIQFEYGGCCKDSGATLENIFKLLQGRYAIFRILPNGLLWFGEFSEEMENYQHSNCLAIHKELLSPEIEPLKYANLSIQEKENNPLVTVIIPTYNRPTMLHNAIESVLNEDYENIEIVVVNDNGVDVSGIVKGFNDSRVKYISHDQNKGLGAARNTGIQNSTGEWICYLDDDDRHFYHHISDLMAFAKETQSSVVYSNGIREIQQKNQLEVYDTFALDLPYNINFDADMLLYQNITPVLCVMHKRECVDKVGGFDEEMKRYEDWSLWIKMSREYPFSHLDKITCAYSWRMDGSTMSSTKNDLFSTLIPVIYKKYEQYANPKVIEMQDQIMKQRGVERLK